jgi:hypothetical protein
MNRRKLSELGSLDLVQEFAVAARQMGAAVLDSEADRANRIFDRMESIDTCLRERGREARLELAALLDHPDRFVRYYAAEYLLGLVPLRARAVIEENATYHFDALAGAARGLLREFDSGAYKPD